MSWSILISSIGLVLVFEGVLPFLSPHAWRNFIQQVFKQNDNVLRAIGLASMLIGLALVCIARDLYL